MTLTLIWSFAFKICRFHPAAWHRQQLWFLAILLFRRSRCIWWSACVFLFGWRWCLEFCRQMVHWSSYTISCRSTGQTMWQDITFRTGHPGLHVSLWWIAGDRQPCLLAQCHVCQHWHKLIISSRSLLQPGFPFSEAMIIHFQKIQRELKNLRWAFHTNLLRYFAPERPCTLRFSTGFLFSQDSSVIDKSFPKISRSQMGGSTTRHGAEVFLWPRSQHADSCVSPPSRIGRELLSIGPYKDWLTWTLEAYPQNSCWNSLRQLYSCLSQWHLLGTMVLPWIALSLQHPTASTGPRSTKSLSPCATRGTGAPSYCSIWGFITIRRARN